MRIYLTQGLVALVDFDDWERLAHYKWYAMRRKKAETNEYGVFAPSGRGRK